MGRRVVPRRATRGYFRTTFEEYITCANDVAWAPPLGAGGHVPSIFSTFNIASMGIAWKESPHTLSIPSPNPLTVACPVTSALHMGTTGHEYNHNYRIHKFSVKYIY